jgi:hypothetical protein
MLEKEFGETRIVGAKQAGHACVTLGAALGVHLHIYNS